MSMQPTATTSDTATIPGSGQGYRKLDQAQEVCPTTTRRMAAEGAILVDVREPDEIARLAFDVPNLVAIPLNQLETRFDELPRDKDLVLVCQGGARSLKATYFLMYQGFERVANMQGGILKWASKGFPVRGDAAQGPEASANTGCDCGTDVAKTCC